MNSKFPAFEPANNLEHVLVDSQAGRLSVTDLIDTLLRSQVFVLLDKDPGPSGIWDNSVSLLVLNGSGGAPMIAIFTSPERASDWPKRLPQFAFGLLIDFRWILKGVSSGVRIVINPGLTVGLEMPPSGVMQLKADADARD